MALFRTTDELKDYISIDVNMKFSKIEPSIESAEEHFIKPLLGNSFYTEILDAYEAATNLPDDLTVDQQNILTYIQRALAHYAAFLAVEEMGVSVGDLGIQQQFNQNSQPAPSWKVNNLKLKYITSADRAADKLLEFLELNASASKYNTWFSDAEANTKMSGSIVYSTSIASKHIDINESRRVFLRLKKRIKDIEASYVKRLICTDQLQEIITQLRTGSLTSDNKKLVEKIEPIITKRALYLTLPSLAVSITDEGITVQSSNDTTIQKQIASQEEKKALMRSLKEDEFGYEADEAELDLFLKENISLYPLIEASPCWTGKPTDGEIKWKADNDPCNKHFSV